MWLGSCQLCICSFKLLCFITWTISILDVANFILRMQEWNFFTNNRLSSIGKSIVPTFLDLSCHCFSCNLDNRAWKAENPEYNPIQQLVLSACINPLRQASHPNFLGVFGSMLLHRIWQIIVCWPASGIEISTLVNVKMITWGRHYPHFWSRLFGK